MKTCVLCGKQFQPKFNAQRVCDDKHYRNCVICGKPFEISAPSDARLCCSKECTVKKRENTQLARTGYRHALQNPESLQKAKQTTLSRYGVEHAAQSQVIKDKVKKLFNDKYGVDSPFQMADFWDKAKVTNLQRYGTEYAIQNKSVQAKSMATCNSKYGVDHVIQSDNVMNKLITTCEDRYGVPYPCMTDNCRISAPSTISNENRRIADLITSSAGLICELDHVKIGKFSYDIHIKDTNILIEVDPTYTHNAAGNHWNPNGIDKNYHISKTNLAIDNGYRCIHIFDWDDLQKILHMLMPKSKIFARKCKVKEVSVSDAIKFENCNHLQGGCKGQSVCLGLYYDDNLIEVMTFGNPRYVKSYSWELLRLCTHYNYRVVGGASKLFNYFVDNYSGNIISYCDLSKFDGHVYETIGMKLCRITPPAKVWSKGVRKVTDNLLRQRGYDQLFQANYGKGASNEQLMLDNGWLPIYDCGQAVYEFNR